MFLQLVIFGAIFYIQNFFKESKQVFSILTQQILNKYLSVCIYKILSHLLNLIKELFGLGINKGFLISLSVPNLELLSIITSLPVLGSIFNLACCLETVPSSTRTWS